MQRAYLAGMSKGAATHTHNPAHAKKVITGVIADDHDLFMTPEAARRAGDVGLQWSFGHSDSLDGLGLSMSLEHNDPSLGPHGTVHTPIKAGSRRRGSASGGLGSGIPAWGPLQTSLLDQDVGELSLSLSFTGMSLDDSKTAPNLEVVGHSAHIARGGSGYEIHSMEPPPPGSAAGAGILSPSELPSPRVPAASEGKSRHISPTVSQLRNVGRGYREGIITEDEKHAMKDRILTGGPDHREARPESGAGAGAGAAPASLLSPTAQQLQKVNEFFKGGKISKEEKDVMKLRILETSTDSLSLVL